MKTSSEIGNYINISGSYSRLGGGRYTADGETKVYKATPHEIAWLEACEKVGMFVPEDEITSAKPNIKSTGPDFSLKEEPEITKGIDLIN